MIRRVPKWQRVGGRRVTQPWAWQDRQPLSGPEPVTVADLRAFPANYRIQYTGGEYGNIAELSPWKVQLRVGNAPIALETSKAKVIHGLRGYPSSAQVAAEIVWGLPALPTQQEKKRWRNHPPAPRLRPRRLEPLRLVLGRGARKEPMDEEVAWATEMHDAFWAMAQAVKQKHGTAVGLAFVLRRRDQGMLVVPREQQDTPQWAEQIRQEVWRRRADMVVVVTEGWAPPPDLPPEAAMQLQLRGIRLADLPGARDTLVVSAETAWGGRMLLCAWGHSGCEKVEDTGWSLESGDTMSRFFRRGTR